MPGRQIFGDENARVDTNLYKCSVTPPSYVEHQPILGGRWGVGKTATFLLRHRKLTDALREVDPKHQYIWYLDEGGLDPDTLILLNQNYGITRTIFKRTLETLWFTEILRINAKILNILYEYYGRPTGDKWRHIKVSDYNDRYGRSIWSSMADILNATGDVGKAVSKAISAISGTFSEKFEESIQSCLSEIVHFQAKPVVVIEPVETPLSIFEKSDVNLSQSILVSLLDLFIRKLDYSPERGQNLRVEISVPWHRSVRENLREPQKLPQYMGRLSWEESHLREFMARRIDNEFSIVRRHVAQRRDSDAWDALFSPTVRNLWANCDETSFKYFLRHTHHRTRDLMRLARNAIHAQVDISRAEYPNITADHVISGSSVTQISPTAMRQGIQEALRYSSDDRIMEASRRFPRISEMVEILRGIDSPFSAKVLADRSATLPDKIDDIIKILWDCGIIGFEIIPNDDANIQLVEKNVGPQAISEFQLKHGTKCRRYFLFEYNTDLSTSQIERSYPATVVEKKLVVHPVFSESFGIRTTRDYPIGV